MPCYGPLSGWLSKDKTAKGKRRVVFNRQEGLVDRPVQVPCGRCIGCRLEYSRQWAVRCMHEASLYEKNCFVTLTYDDKHLPKNSVGLATLRPDDFVLFMKRLRKLKGPGVRFFQAGEYGDLGRPHHHCLLFNCWFDDAVVWRESGERSLYRSKELERLWPYGYSSFGKVTFESSAYVARYTVKKVVGVGAEAHYCGRVVEFCTMSRRPGIGRGWLERYCSDVYPKGELVMRGGVVSKPPRYYDDYFSTLSPDVVRRLKLLRQRVVESKPDSWHSLSDKEAIVKSEKAIYRKSEV